MVVAKEILERKISQERSFLDYDDMFVSEYSLMILVLSIIPSESLS